MSKAVGYNDTVWVSIYQILLLQGLDKKHVFCNILSFSNWQIDVSPETFYWQPNVVEKRGSQDKDQRAEQPRRPRRRSVTPELWYLYNISLAPQWAVCNLTSTLKLKEKCVFAIVTPCFHSNLQKKVGISYFRKPRRHIFSYGLAQLVIFRPFYPSMVYVLCYGSYCISYFFFFNSASVFCVKCVIQM